MKQPDTVDPGALRRVLLIKLRHHGDVLLSSPVLQALKAAAPHAEIDALVYADTGAMLRGHPDLDQLHLLPRESRTGSWLRRLRDEWRLLRTLRRRRYDLLLHLTDSPRGAWLAWALRPRWAVAHERDKGQSLWRRAFTHLADGGNGTPRPTVERHLDLLRCIGIHPAPAQCSPTLALSAQALDSARRKMQQAGWTGEPYAVLHPGSRWMFKAWTASGNARVIEHVAGQGLAVVMTAAPDPRERELCQAILQAATTPVVDLCGQLSLEELAAVIAHARLFIGVDSVPAHIAAAVGTPGVALFGPSNEKEWRPWSETIEVVASQRHPCRPCGRDGCGGSKVSECLTSLPAEQVIAALDRVMLRDARR